MKIKPLMLIPPALFAVFAIFALVGMYRENPDDMPSTREGGIAPQIIVENLSDKPALEHTVLTSGEVKLVNFWASWCAPCRAEHPALETLADEGVTIYGINYKDRPIDALGFLDELGDPFAAHGTDAQGRTGLEWGLFGVPETFVLDAEGRVVLRFAGPITSRVLNETIRPAIAKAANE